MAAVLWTAAFVVPALAQTSEPPSESASRPNLATSLAQRAEALPDLLAENGDLASAFTPEFFAAVPQPRLEQVLANLRQQHGAPQRLLQFDGSERANSGTAIVAYERADVTIVLAVDASGRLTGLRITDVATRNDTMAALTDELASLHGAVGWGIYRLHGRGPPQRIAGDGHAAHLAVGSSFKLVVLATLDAEIAAGRMRWSDVITLDYSSVPSGMIQDWPPGTPLTLQTAAQLMIAISDNTATDLLIRHIGRERIEAFARIQGGLSGSQAFPMLTTIEATVLKNPALVEARQQWLNGNESQRRAALRRFAPLFRPENVDYSVFATPADINRIEWFASADSMARLLIWFAYHASDTARAILAVNPGIPTAGADRWAFIGFKGGSEPGVAAMNLLLRNTEGHYFAIAMSWNNERASVDEGRLSALAARAAALINRQEVR